MVFEADDFEPPGMDWMNRPCVLKLPVMKREVMNEVASGYLVVKTRNVAFLAAFHRPVVEEHEHAHELVIQDKSQIIDFNKRPVFFLEAVTRNDAAQASTTKTFLIDGGKAFVRYHPYLKPGL